MFINGKREQRSVRLNSSEIFWFTAVAYVTCRSQ